VIRFHLDEHVDRAVARGLRLRAIDVTTAADAGLLSAADEEHVAFALREQRVIYTNDADFLALHQRGIRHAGIAFCAPGSRTVGKVVRLLCLLNDCLSSGEIAGRVEYF
jgi:uncharacterized protein with PIN domain